MNEDETTDTVLRYDAVGKQFGRRDALRDCSFALPRGRVAALVGANGAGKTTLLRMAVGLARPSAGRIEVLGENPAATGTPAGVSYVAQDKPLYRRFRVREMLRAAAVLNSGGNWDGAHAASLIADAGIGVGQRIGELSAGQRARVAIALALGRRPRLLLLDEPLAELDPLARREIMGTVLAAVAETGMTVLLSSHVVTDIEDACDHLVLLGDRRVMLDGGIDGLLAGHRIHSGPATSFVDDETVVHRSNGGRHTVALVRDHEPAAEPGPSGSAPTLEELVVAYLQAPAASDPEAA
ncbi:MULTISPECIES: ATP-binding cassette domain-containing protein [Pseudonocardia]|uniref:ABC transporter ATP-binding protein n=2 Tax=Pseudonocardia TaxID=1847 RepID=A0ABQ0S2X8_9PSEU|nr:MULTISPECIES: ABC transporter ATP-binding protein [Pseudonocardia]OSY36365.1 putative ABC transporter ATP-binding protein YxlF [Pseudonocardia autotrophica]TDN72679.1 ABC-2 type transport system ATP-binding protein [Pseudonocardia autotrophica]BBG03390.1 ABC transporter ATP-binding protein [Pseudonocardia autotrophica]GEC27255.1 ABC transporter ATP-binding protein [Pseudonocardia saturnea]